MKSASSREKCGKGRRKRNRATRGQSHGSPDHRLLGDEELVETLPVRRFELLAERGILHVAVERDDAGIHLAELGDGGAIRFARGDHLAELVIGRRHRSRLGGRWGRRRRRDRDLPTPLVNHLRLELGDGALRLVLLERLAVPARLTFDERDPVALLRPRQQHRRPPLGGGRLLEGRDDLHQVVAVDDAGVPAERMPALAVRDHVVLELGRAALTQSIDIHDRAQRLELVKMRRGRGFPDRSLRRLSVAHQHVGAIRRLDPPRVERHADARGQSLAERSGGDIDERQPWRRMAFEIGAQLPQLEQRFARQRAQLGPHGIENRRGVAFRQDESIGVWMAGIPWIEPHLAEEQRRQQLGGRHARGGVAACGRRRGSNRFDAKTRRDVLERWEQ